MSKGMRAVLILLSAAGIAASWVLPALIVAVHHTHAYSTYVEFSKRDLINTDKLEEWRRTSGEKDYRIDRRMQEIGALDHHLTIMSFVLKAFFVINAILVATSRTSTQENPT